MSGKTPMSPFEQQLVDARLPLDDATLEAIASLRLRALARCRQRAR